MKDKKNYYLGEISERYESSGPGTISTGKGDHGGVSYGTYQLSTASGTIDEYLRDSAYKNEFLSLSPNTKEFNEKWRKLAKDDPGFSRDQRDFIKRTHYDVQVARLKKDGLDLSDRGSAVQEAIWSSSIQYRGLTRVVFEKGLEEKFGKGYKLGELTDKDIVQAVQDYKITHNEELFVSSPTWWSSLHARAVSEKEDLLALVDGKPLPARGVNQDIERRNLKIGMYGDDVQHIQDELAQLGYTDAKGHVLHPDKSYGAATRHAVQAFQRDFGLTTDGKAGARTQEMLEAAVKESHRVTADLSPALPTFADTGHPQHALYERLKAELPVGTSQERLMQATAACHMAGMNGPKDLYEVQYGESGVFFSPAALTARGAIMDVMQPAPSVQESMQQTQAYDQQQARFMANIYEQQQQQVHAQQGPVMGGPPIPNR